VNEYAKKRHWRLTASNFPCILAKPETKRYKGYMEDIVEHINGVPEFQDEKPWFWHGKEWEDEAIDFYEWRMQRDVERFGGSNPKLFVHPRHEFIGCSPDFKDQDGGGEIKCHKSLKQFLIAEKAGIPTQHIPQVQGTMWILNASWWNYVSYFKKNKLIHIYCVYPDLKYHKKLEKACLDFWAKIQEKLKLST